MQFRTSMARSYAEDALAAVASFNADEQRAARKTACECRTCFYLRSSRIGGAAMTYWNCGLCGVENLHSSTATPRICRECAEEHELCAECGGDVKMRGNRSKWPAPVVDLPAPPEGE
jgi:hypothetical protein